MPEKTILLSIPSYWEVYASGKLIAYINRTEEDFFKVTVIGLGVIGEYYSVDEAERAILKELGGHE